MSAEPAPPGARVLEWSFTARTRCHLLAPREPPGSGRPPLLVVLHGQGQSGARHVRWMGPAVPGHFAAAFPDGFHAYEVRSPGRPPRIGHAWYLYDGDRSALAQSLAESDARLWGLIDAAASELGADRDSVWLCGFSQGAYQAQTSAVLHPERVAGWIAQAGGFRAEYVHGRIPDLGGRAVLLQHGRQDTATPPERSEAAAAVFSAHGAHVTLELHDAAHVITPAMAVQARDWLTRQVPAG